MKKVYYREVYQLLSSVSEFGGIVTFLRIVCSILSMYFAEFFYNVSVMKRIYMLNKDIFKSDYKYAGESGRIEREEKLKIMRLNLNTMDKS